MKRKRTSKNRPTAKEIEATMAFFGVPSDRPRTMYDETFPRERERRPKIKVIQTIIEF